MRTWGVLLGGLAALLWAGVASAQTSVSGGALERFEPAVPGDAFFGVPSPWVGGHLVPRATALVDYGYRPLSIEDGNQRRVIVSGQTYLHLAASFALWDRVSISADLPIAVAQGGDSPTIAGVKFQSPGSAQVGDLRLGARGRLYGDYWSGFQLGVQSYFFIPTAPSGSYAGDGSFRAEPSLLLGGRFTHFVWSLAGGTEIKTSSHPSQFKGGAGAAAVVGDNSFFQIGPELTFAVPFKTDESFSTKTATITEATPVAAEVLLGAKLRPISWLVIGAGAGPGLTNGYGTPKVFAVGSVGYDPLPARRSEDPLDRDGDGIIDSQDACPDVPGVRSDDPKKNGCPKVEEPPPKPEVTVRKRVKFKFGKAELNETVEAPSDEFLHEVQETLASHPGDILEVQGHADNIGEERYNVNLSTRRALAVKTWLVKRGVPSDRLVAKGYGFSMPEVPNDNDQDRQENRRVQLVVRPKDWKP